MNHHLPNNIPQIFAPVIIPTLCRYNHLKKCIESLQRCTHAEKTNVYIGLDYPLKEEHWEGYYKICEYLTSIESSHGFNSLKIIKRERNYGIGEMGNFENLRDYVLSFSDRLIASEDDNIFAPAFLDYINKGLEIFKDDQSVLAINGYRHFYNVKFKENNFYRQNIDFSAWGYGIWRDRIELLEKDNNLRYWRTQALNPIKWYKIRKNGLNRILKYIRLLSKKNIIDDNLISVYMGINNMDVIMPKVSLIRNIGWDGSGENCNVDKKVSFNYLTQTIDTSKFFKYIGTGKEFYNENHYIYVKQSYGRLKLSHFISKLIASLFNQLRSKTLNCNLL